MSLAEGFWDDQNRAQALLRKRATAAEKLELAESLTAAVEEASEYLELAVLAERFPGGGLISDGRPNRAVS